MVFLKEEKPECMIRLELCGNFAGYRLLLFSNRPGNLLDMIGSLGFRCRGPGVLAKHCACLGPSDATMNLIW